MSLVSFETTTRSDTLNHATPELGTVQPSPTVRLFMYERSTASS